MLQVANADELPHPPGTQPLWNESWYFDLWSPDGVFGAYVRVGSYPNLGESWLWAYVVRAGERAPLASVCRHDMLAAGESDGADGAASTIDVVGGDARASFYCVEPSRLWRVQVRAGDDLDLDVEWHARAEPFRYPRVTRYEQSCDATGRIRVGNEVHHVEMPAHRDHSWGVRDWWTFGWTWMSGSLGDGSRYHAFRADMRGRFAPAFVVPPGGGVVAVDVDELDLDQRAVASTPMRLRAPDGRTTLFTRSLCRVSTRDGRTGAGWSEWNAPLT